MKPESSIKHQRQLFIGRNNDRIPIYQHLTLINKKFQVYQGEVLKGKL